MKKYTWEEIKKENGVYKTFLERGYPALNSQLGNFDFHSEAGEITVLDRAGRKELNLNFYWNGYIFVKIGG